MTKDSIMKQLETGVLKPETKRKRGRPALARHALEYQPGENPSQVSVRPNAATPALSLNRPLEDAAAQPAKRCRGRPRKA